MNKLKRLVIIALLTAVALSLSYLESFIPIFIPGVKLGLANIIILIMIYEFKFYEAFVADILRILLVALIRGTFLTPVFFMSLSGGIISFIMMLLISKLKIFTAIGVSAIGSIAHSFGQLLIATFLISSEAVLYYLPFVAILSLLTGIISGILADIYLRRNITNKFLNVKIYYKAIDSESE